MRIAVTYIVMLVVFVSLDAAWLGLLAGSLYRKTLGNILLPSFRALPAILFYLLQVVGAMVFVIPAASRSGSWITALGYGALFGLFTYATYDLTNYATIARWTPQLAALDIAWGTILTAASTTLGYLAGCALSSGS